MEKGGASFLVAALCAVSGCNHAAIPDTSDGGASLDLATTSGDRDGGQGGDLAGPRVNFDVTVPVAAAGDDATDGQGEPWIGINANGFSLVSYTQEEPYVDSGEISNIYFTDSPLRLGPYSTPAMTPAYRGANGVVDSLGRFHVVAMDGNRGVAYSRYTAAGKFEFAQWIDQLNVTGWRPQIAIGPNDAIAVAWTRRYLDENLYVLTTETPVAVSLDGGMSFGAVVMAAARSTAFVTSVAWGPDSTIYVALAELDDPPPIPTGGNQHVRATVSTASGPNQAFGSNVDLPVDIDSTKYAGIDAATRAESIIAINEARLAVAPSGRVVAIWSGPSGEDLDIFCATSDDRAVSWSAPVTVNDDLAPAFHILPAVAIDGAGRIHVEWADGRGSPTGAIAAALYRPMYAISRYAGNSFSPNAALRDTPSALHPSPADPMLVPSSTWIPLWVGDAWNIAVQGDNVYPIWSDTSSGHAQVYLTTGVVAP